MRLQIYLRDVNANLNKVYYGVRWPSSQICALSCLLEAVRLWCLMRADWRCQFWMSMELIFSYVLRRVDHFKRMAELRSSYMNIQYFDGKFNINLLIWFRNENVFISWEWSNIYLPIEQPNILKNMFFPFSSLLFRDVFYTRPGVFPAFQKNSETPWSSQYPVVSSYFRQETFSRTKSRFNDGFSDPSCDVWQFDRWEIIPLLYLVTHLLNIVYDFRIKFQLFNFKSTSEFPLETNSFQGNKVDRSKQNWNGLQAAWVEINLFYLILAWMSSPQKFNELTLTS